MNAGHKKILMIAALMRRRRHALFGGHARNAYVPHDPRTTQDIDLLVPDAAAAKRAGEAILALNRSRQRASSGLSGSSSSHSVRGAARVRASASRRR